VYDFEVSTSRRALRSGVPQGARMAFCLRRHEAFGDPYCAASADYRRYTCNRPHVAISRCDRGNGARCRSRAGKASPHALYGRPLERLVFRSRRHSLSTPNVSSRCKTGDHGRTQFRAPWSISAPSRSHLHSRPLPTEHLYVSASPASNPADERSALLLPM
jgi:hypothetical protein